MLSGQGSPDGAATPAAGDGSSPSKGSSRTHHQRFKPQLSCVLCRARKIKCDRNLPCENCVKRELASSCTYRHQGIRSVQKNSNAAKNVQDRVQQLERLVMDLMESNARNGNSSAPNRYPVETPDHPSNASDLNPPEASYVDEAEKLIGRVSVDDKHLNYVGGTHWAEILDHLAELKETVQTEKDDVQIANQYPGPELLLGSAQNISKVDLLAALPSKSVTDRMVDFYFRCMELSSVLIHYSTFRKDYEKFWENPRDADIMWLGLIFSILAVAAHFEQVVGENSSFTTDQALRDPDETVHMFRRKTVQCLILGNYTEPTKYTIECLVLYMSLECFRSIDTQFGLWVVFGIIVRVAMRLGYHRDASHFPNVSIFQGEMQRRLWVTISHLDIQTSCQVGLPRMIPEGMSDTQPPRILFDEDLDENMTVLPPSRPDTTMTPLGFAIARYRITAIFGKIVDQSNSTIPLSYEQVMDLDSTLRDKYEKNPAWVRMRGIDDLINSPRTPKLLKISIYQCYQKSRCILHRRFIVPTTSSFSQYSMSSSVDASIRLLQIQSYLYQEKELGLTLFNRRWRTSLVTHDFCLATMLLCLYLRYAFYDPLSTRISSEPESWTKGDVVDILRESYTIWLEESRRSKEADKIVTAVKKTLEKMDLFLSAENAHDMKPGTDSPMEVEMAVGHETRNPALVNVPQSNGSLPLQSDNSKIQSNLNAMESAMNMSSDFDWGVWDNYFRSNNFADTPPDLLDFENLLFQGPQPNFMGQ